MPKKTVFMIVAIFLFLAAFWNFALAKSSDKDEVVYLKNNIHYQEHANDNKASYANWTNPGKGHRILPVNSAVKIKKWRRGLQITDTGDGTEVLFEFDKGRMNMSRQEYQDLITSPSKIPLDNLSEIDKKGIKEGKAYPGMSKDGVRIALGYPAAHKTPSLESNRWIYWTNRFRSIAVEFDSQGLVK